MGSGPEPTCGGGDFVHDEVKNGHEVGVFVLQFSAAGAVAAGRKNVREIQLFVVGAEIHEEVENLVERFHRIASGAVYFVDDHGHRQAQLQGLLGHESRLGHRPFESVHY